MGLIGMGLGGGLGFAAGGPGGAAIGAGLGNMAEDYLAGPDAPGTAVGAPAAVSYDGTGYDYGQGMQSADGRQAYLANYSMADQDRALAGQSREAQLAELERLRATARGEGPSAAALQMQQAQEQAALNAANIAASARGSSAQALASRDAMRAQQIGAQTSARDTAIIRAQEALQAQQAATGLVTNMRGQAGAERGQSQQQAQFQAGQQQANRGQNDARAMALLQSQIEEAKARAGVQGSNESRALEARMAQMQAANAAYQADRQRSTQMGTALVGAGGAMAAQAGSKPAGPAPTGGQSGGGHAAGENPGGKGWLPVADFSMFDEFGNPIGAPAAPLGGPPLRPAEPSLLVPVAGGGSLVPSPLERSLGATAMGFAPSDPAVPRSFAPAPAAPAAAPPAAPTVTRLADVQRAAPAAGGPRPEMPAGVGNFAGDSEGYRALVRKQIADELAKGRGGYQAPRPESRQDTSGQRQRSMGEAPEITQQVRDLWSGPQPLERIAPPTLSYSPTDVLSVSAPPPDAKTPKQKMQWAAQEAADWTKRGVSVAQLDATGVLRAPDWRPANWATLSGEEQDALERAHRDDPKAIAGAEKRRQLIGMIDVRHGQALDATGAANEAARARYDRDVERFGPEGIAGAVTAQAKAQQRFEDAAVGTAEEKSAADVKFLEEKAALLRGAEDRNKALLDRINATVADVQSAKIDPGALWNSRTTGQKFALAIATGMGAFAQAMGQGPNTAANIIEKATDDDIKAQIANIDKKKGDLTELQKLYKHTLDVTGDKIAAEDAMRLAAHSAIDARLAEAQQTAKTEQAASKVQEMRARFELQRVEREAALSERMRGTEGVNFKINPATAGGMGGGTSIDRLKALQRELISTSHGQATMDLAAGAASAKGGGAAPEYAVLGGQKYQLTHATSPAQGAEIRSKMGTIDQMEKSLAAVEEAKKAYLLNKLPTLGKRLDNAVANYTFIKSKGMEQGIVKKEEMEMSRDALTAAVEGKDIIMDERAALRAARESAFSQYGAVPVGKQ